ncbi:MAG: hypothetical protein JO256_02025 [Alphaproteobacteria bacterium]|nr:hypothetical protein [Alphaproteobacteria bacterium]
MAKPLANPVFRKVIYSGTGGHQPGLFDGQYRIFNGEGAFGLLIYGVIAAWLILRWVRAEK